MHTRDKTGEDCVHAQDKTGFTLEKIVCTLKIQLVSRW